MILVASQCQVVVNLRQHAFDKVGPLCLLVTPQRRRVIGSLVRALGADVSFPQLNVYRLRLVDWVGST